MDFIDVKRIFENNLFDFAKMNLQVILSCTMLNVVLHRQPKRSSSE